jgi:hypothetical protein
MAKTFFVRQVQILQRLFYDAETGKAACYIIVVYDVSHWFRFQNPYLSIFASLTTRAFQSAPSSTAFAKNDWRAPLRQSLRHQPVGQRTSEDLSKRFRAAVGLAIAARRDTYIAQNERGRDQMQGYRTQLSFGVAQLNRDARFSGQAPKN